VHSICRDIRTLDAGKRNLVRTITTVKRFHMLLSGADQLEQMLARTQYRPAAQLLQAMASLFVDIGQQLAVALWPPSAQRLQQSVQRCREQLFLKILDEFKNFMHDVTSSDALSVSHASSSSPSSSLASSPGFGPVSSADGIGGGGYANGAAGPSSSSASSSSSSFLPLALEAAAATLADACEVLEVMGDGSKYGSYLQDRF
jgi:hypothetical protein